MSYTIVNLSFENPGKDSFKAALEQINVKRKPKERIKQVDVFKAVCKKISDNPEYIKELGL